MATFTGLSLLELVEDFAYNNNLIGSEEGLSAAFDETIAPLVVEQYGADDVIAMSEAFNDWTDSMCTDGQIHAEQYDKYTYIGTYA